MNDRDSGQNLGVKFPGIGIHSDGCSRRVDKAEHPSVPQILPFLFWGKHRYDGSVIAPASFCGIVGIKPTVGLLSRSGIIPISKTQDILQGRMRRSGHLPV